MPDDWGLKPPIDTLPQIAQERAMLVLETVITGTPDLEGSERGGMIAPSSREPPDVFRTDMPRCPPACPPYRPPVDR